MGYTKRELSDSTVYIPSIKSGSKVSVIVFYPGIPVGGKIGKEYMPPLILKGAPTWFDKYVISIPNQHTTDWGKVKSQYESEMSKFGLQTLNISVGIYSGSGNGNTSIQKSLTGISGLKNLMLMDPSGGAGTTTKVKNNGTNVFMVYNPKNWQGDANASIRNGFPALEKAVGTNVIDTKSSSYDHNQMPIIFLNKYKSVIEPNLSTNAPVSPAATPADTPATTAKPGSSKGSSKGSESQRYINSIDANKRNTISLVVNACKAAGVTNPIFQAGLCGIVSKESDFSPKGETSYFKTGAARIRSIFGARFKAYTDAQIDVIKKDEKKFFSVVYGELIIGKTYFGAVFPGINKKGKLLNSPGYGDGEPATNDGWTYRGRGFNGLTYRANYEKIGKQLGEDLEGKPEIMDKLDISCKALVQYFLNGIGNNGSLLSTFGVTKGASPKDTANGIKDIATVVRLLYQLNAGPGSKEGTPPRLVSLHYEDIAPYVGADGDLVFPNDKTLFGFTKARNRAPLFYKLITGGSLPPNPNIPPAVVTPPPPVGVQKAEVVTTPAEPVTESNEPVTQESSKGNNDIKPEDNPKPVDEVTPGLSNIFPPTVKVEPIKIKHKGESKEYLKEWSADIGTRPFVWYNSYQIDDRDIDYFALYHDGLLPALTLSFRDSMNLMKDKGFPLDDTKIKIFLSSRTKNIRHILLEFKISNFSVNNDVYTVKGVLNINGLHLRKFKSYSKKTSFFAIQDICKEVGLGFNSNITDSKDQMTWINTGKKVYDFMDEILSYSYISDEGFSYGYVDFFYNFNYVDIEKELTRDVSNDKGIDSSGLGKDVTLDDKRIQKLSLSNDRSFQESDSYVSEYKILNNSTAVSLDKGYLNISKYYDSFKKEYLIFDVDSITSEGSKTIIMKGSPQDESFYKENVNTTYVGKLDPDNAHANYNYSYVHNSQNIEDLQKIAIKLTLPNPNYNLYRFQKVVVLITNNGATPTSKLKNERISGDWFIIEIKFIYSGGSYNQEVTLIKRELELSEEEFNEEQSAPASSNEAEPPKNNPVEKTTNPTDLTNTDAPVPDDSYKPTKVKEQKTATPASDPPPVKETPVIVKKDTNPPPPGKYDLDYVILDDATKKKLASNNGTVYNLVYVMNDDGKNGYVMADFIAGAYLDLKAAALKDGFKLSLSSGFRPPWGPEVRGKTKSGKSFTVTTQEYLYNGWIARKPGFNEAAAPTRSNHGNGIALDLNTGSRKKKSLNTNLYKWLVTYGWKYGWVREVYSEEWHFDYIPELAKKGPYSKLASKNKSFPEGGANLYYKDLGIHDIRIS